MSVVLVIGSGPNAVQAQHWPRQAFDHVLAINNAFAIRPDWDSLIHPEDFPAERQPETISDNQTIVTAQDYVPAQNRYGGFIYAGGTMAFTAGYWALAHHRPKVMAFIGCDMVYAPQGSTHFYGTGAADPLRDDVTLQSLEAKSARLAILAAAQGCAMVNLSQDETRLTCPRATLRTLREQAPLSYNSAFIRAAFEAEDRLGYMVRSGRYWEQADRFDPVELARIDTLWLKAALAPSSPIRDTVSVTA